MLSFPFPIITVDGHVTETVKISVPSVTLRFAVRSLAEGFIVFR
jgi:hypothetical protein